MGNLCHGLDCQPLLNNAIYRKFQKEFCDFLKVISGLTYAKTGKHISYNVLLKKFKLRSIMNTHKYLALNRLNTVYHKKKPKRLYDILKTCVIDNFGSPPCQPRDPTFPFEQQNRTRVAQNFGSYDVKFKDLKDIPMYNKKNPS